MKRNQAVDLHPGPRGPRVAGVTLFAGSALLLWAGLVVWSVSLAQSEAEAVELVRNTTPDGAEFWVMPRKSELTYYPCAQCHKLIPPNPEVRKLFSPHPSELDHGDERIWCLTCHDIEDRNTLTNLLGESVDFDRAAEVCASCHMQRHQDWMFGGHGKRRGDWQGERVIYSCPQCHDPHTPTIKPRAPKPPPPVRKGLARPLHPEAEEYLSVWERLESDDHD